MTNTAYEADMEAFIRQTFEENYEQLRMESGMAIAPYVKETALNQVLLYWRILRDIAENVTDTEVRLSLPLCSTPKGRTFTIQGVVDILRDNDRTVMYDIKTHDAEYVRANLELYEQQLNVYAFIWQELRQQGLDEMAIIATDYPESVRDALLSGDPAHLAYALSQWQPVVNIDYDLERVQETIHDFGKAVDDIEENRFAARSVADLMSSLPGTVNIRFASRVCINCDARFSCSSYRQYALQGRAGIAEQTMRQYYGEVPTGLEQEHWRTAGLDASPDSRSLRADFSGR